MSPNPAPFFDALARLDLESALPLLSRLSTEPSARLAGRLFPHWRSAFGPWEGWPPELQSRSRDALSLIESLSPGFLWRENTPIAAALPSFGLPFHELPPSCQASMALSPFQARRLACRALSERPGPASIGWLRALAEPLDGLGAMDRFFDGPNSPSSLFEAALDGGASFKLLLTLLDGPLPSSRSFERELIGRNPEASALVDSIAQRASLPGWQALLSHCERAWRGPGGALAGPGLFFWDPLLWRLTQSLPSSPQAASFLPEALLFHALRSNDPLGSLSRARHQAPPWQAPCFGAPIAHFERRQIESALSCAPAQTGPRPAPRL